MRTAQALVGGLLLAALLSGAAMAAPTPVLTTFILEETTQYGILPGTLASGYEMHLDGIPATNYQLDVNTAAANVPLDADQYGFYLAGYPADFFAYWHGRGVNALAAPLTWQGWMWRIITGLEPIVYLDADGLGGYALLDGLQWDRPAWGGGPAAALPLAIPGDYPDGTYTVVGRIRNQDGDLSAPITIRLTFFHGDAETDARDGSGYLDPTGQGQALMNPGDLIVLQRFKIEDPGTAYDAANLDWTPDGYDTHIKTIEFGLVGPPPRADVERLWLYQDNGDLQFDPLVDTPLWIPLLGFSPPGPRAVFGAPVGQPGSAFVIVPDDSIAWFFLVAQLKPCCYNLNEQLQVQIVNIETAYPAGTGSSRMEAVFPVVSAVRYAFATSPGVCDVTLNDQLLPVGPNLVPEIAPGADNQVLQWLRLDDLGADALPTAIRSMTFRKVAGTLDTTQVTDFRLWIDNDTDGAVTAGDVSIAYKPMGDLAAGVSFSALPNALIELANGVGVELLLAVRVEASAPEGATLQVEVVAETADGLGDPDGGGMIAKSSHFCTAMPVVATDAVEVAGAAPADQDYETNVADMTVGRTIFSGSQGIVVQEVEIYDADDPAQANAAGGPDDDWDPDGFPTRVDTVTVDLDAGAANNNLANNGCITRLAVWLESDGVLGFTPGDTLLDAILNPLSGDFPITFGDPGVLLFEVPDDAEVTVYVVADFDCNACVCNDDLWTNFAATAFYDGVNHSSGFEHDPAVAPPLPVAFPIAPAAGVRLLSTVGIRDREADLTDATLTAFIQPSDTGVVIQEFLLEDPGTRGDAVNDGVPVAVAEMVVRLAPSSTIDPEDIVNLHLYREFDATPGYTGGDILIQTVVGPILDGRSIFIGAPLFAVASVGRFYVVADFAGVGLANGEFLFSTVILHTACVTSGIEDLMPLVAHHPVVVGTGAGIANVIVHDAAIHPTGAGLVDISTTAPDMADFQVGPTETLLITNSDLLDVDGVVGVPPYTVEGVNIVDPDTAGQPIEVRFTARLIAGQAPAAGVFAQLEVTGTGSDGDVCDAAMTGLDVFRDPAGADLLYTLDPGVITLDVTAPVPGGTLAGDVNLDGGVDITDARWAAEFALGMRPLTAAQKANADVAPPHIPPDANIDITDARWIAEASIGIRTLSAMAAAPFAPTSLATATLEVSPMGQLLVSGSTAELADIQGTLHFDPAEITITDVTGLNGFQVLASVIDNIAGEVRFAAAKLSGAMIAEGPVVRFETADDASAAALDVNVLRDVQGRDISYELLTSVQGAVLSFGCSPNPVDDIHTTTFSVKGTLPVDQIRVRIYNFSGNEVFDSGWGPNDLDWHLENSGGGVLANGVYYYRIEVLFVGQDEPVLTGIGKVAVYR